MFSGTWLLSVSRCSVGPGPVGLQMFSGTWSCQSPDVQWDLVLSVSRCWYWGSVTANEAKEILQDASEGTFLLRDSSQRDYLFTISAMTSAGPTNLRIEYKHGKFKLDSVVLVKPRLRQFDSVVHLVEHYVQLSRIRDKAPPTTAGPNGTVQLLLTHPVYTTTPALQHLCRIAINRTTQQVQNLPIPNRLKDYLMDYSYNV
ncbi:suppressor of cytokine signaling 2 [Nematolebias whitei]|uniref:suppressor of cytokine signaling 2 n=1 Tax=Nematolebias whitei TaxID=451745 RepID=UPI00189B21E1|nr:suppressor of cytokine signaling 2 [Nematolebias whitei]